jgi:muconolactone delta-isomerase
MRMKAHARNQIDAKEYSVNLQPNFTKGKWNEGWNVVKSFSSFHCFEHQDLEKVMPL